MKTCPNCGGDVPEGPAIVCGYDHSKSHVSLGCGTLILIALIVLFFSGGRETKEQLQGVQDAVRRIESKLDRLAGAPERPQDSAERAE